MSSRWRIVGGLVLAGFVACGDGEVVIGEASSGSEQRLPPVSRVCGAVECAEGEECCYATGLCTAIGSDTCPRPAPGTMPPPHVGISAEYDCAANSHCGEGEFCDGYLCMGPGWCTSMTNCGTGPIACGCDGVTYPTYEASCLARVRARTVAPGACGPNVAEGEFGEGEMPFTSCGFASPCPPGLTCCAITGLCYDAPEQDWLCTFPPEGTKTSCLDDSQCTFGTYCKSESCGEPGGCVNKGQCNAPQLDPVCGCDGVDYLNEECASSEGVNIAHEGECARAP